MRIVLDLIQLLIDTLNAISAAIQLYKLVTETGRNKKADRSGNSGRNDS